MTLTDTPIASDVQRELNLLRRQLLDDTRHAALRRAAALAADNLWKTTEECDARANAASRDFTVARRRLREAEIASDFAKERIEQLHREKPELFVKENDGG